MRIARNISKLSLFIAVVAVLTSINVHAQSSSANAAQGLQISPTRIEINKAERGKTYNISVKLVNVTASDLFYKPVVKDFGAANETGSPRLFIDTKMPRTASIKSWLSVIPDFTLKSRESKTINASITVPVDAEPGGHYGALLFSGTAPELNTTGVGLAASNGPLILVSVGSDKDIVEKAELASFYAAGKSDGKASFLFENGPISFITRIKNTGNVHVKPNGAITLRDMFGNTVASISINKDMKDNVLPKSIRRFDQAKYGKSWMFGLYTADLALAYGSQGQAITSTISFWVIPYKIILATLFVLATIFYILSRLIKVYNKRIIEQSKNETKKSEQKNKSSGK